ncbi:MAG TPA: hypothetical protein PKY12_01900 [Catalimonadaceae bacterium]|nr:hypothetical protein [Catalimonadaceae bacterium]
MIRNTKILKLAILSSAIGFSTYSCKEENPTPNEENELITTIRLRLTDSNGATLSAAWKDLTPNDGAGRSIDTLLLNDSTEYSGTIEFLDETKNPVRDLTEEIRNESKDHLIVYKAVSPLANNNLEVTRTDKDQNNFEIGLTYSLKTRFVGNGSIQIILRHQPGEKNGTETPGDSDVDVLIPVVIR